LFLKINIKMIFCHKKHTKVHVFTQMLEKKIKKNVTF